MGWFASRWGRLFALLVATGCVVASMFVPWTEALASLYIQSDLDAPLRQDAATAAHLPRHGLPAYLYVPLAGLLLLVAAAGVIVPAGRDSRVLGGAAVALAGLVLVDLLVVWVRLQPALEALAERWAELARFGASRPADSRLIWFAFPTHGLEAAVVGVLAAAMLALATVWPGAGRLVTAATGTLLVVASLLLPWGTTYRATAGGVEHEHEWWYEYGPLAVALVGGTLLLVGLVWWAALRRSTRGRLVLLLGSLPLALALLVAHDAVRLDRDEDLANTLVRAPAEVAQFVVLILGLSALLSWRAARRRTGAAR
jgi:hypothetical protein